MLHYYFMQVSQRLFIISWASCQIRKIVGAHAPGMFNPSPRVSDPDMYHGTCVTHVPWSLTSGFLWNRWWWEPFPAFPAHAQPVILRVWQEAHASVITSHLKIFGTRLLYIHGHYLRNAWQEGSSPVTGEFPTQKAIDAKNVSIWWCHHVYLCSVDFIIMALYYTCKIGKFEFPIFWKPMEEWSQIWQLGVYKRPSRLIRFRSCFSRFGVLYYCNGPYF